MLARRPAFAMDQEFELETIQVEDVHWWYRGRRLILHSVLESLGLPTGAQILDAGCGSGRNMLELAHYGTVNGVELSPTSVAAAKARHTGEVTQGSIDALPFEDDSFDLITSLDVLEHIEDDRAALRELRRVARPGGLLLLTVPAYPWLWSSHDEINHHCRRYTRATLLAAAAEAGWRPRLTTHFNALLLPAAAAWRSTERFRQGARNGASNLTATPSYLNGALEQPLRFEAQQIRRGRRIPFGLSLLAVFESSQGS